MTIHGARNASSQMIECGIWDRFGPINAVSTINAANAVKVQRIAAAGQGPRRAGRQPFPPAIFDPRMIATDQATGQNGKGSKGRESTALTVSQQYERSQRQRKRSKMGPALPPAHLARI